MEQQMNDWHPSKQEVDEIIRELRPIIDELAYRDRIDLGLQCIA